jgi:hypothetical protein
MRSRDVPGLRNALAQSNDLRGALSGLRVFQQQTSFSRRDSPEVCAYFRVLRNKRAQGKPDASRIRWPCVQGRVEKHTSIAVTNGSADIRLSLHDERYGLFRALPGALSPVIASNALRLAIRSEGFSFVQLKHQPRVPGPHGFAVRLLLRPSITPVTIANTDIDGVRPTIIPKRARCSQRPS